jgi:zinc protease
VLSLPGRFETNSGIGGALAETFVFGLPLDYHSRLPAQFGQVNAAAVLAVARKYLAPERMVVVAVGDRKQIAPQLDALKLGPPELRDTEGQLVPVSK